MVDIKDDLDIGEEQPRGVKDSVVIALFSNEKWWGNSIIERDTLGAGLGERKALTPQTFKLLQDRVNQKIESLIAEGIVNHIEVVGLEDNSASLDIAVNYDNENINYNYTNI